MKKLVLAFFLSHDVGDEMVDEVNLKLKKITDVTAVCTNIKNGQNHGILNVKVEDSVEDIDSLAGRLSNVLNEAEYVHVEFHEIAERPE